MTLRKHEETLRRIVLLTLLYLLPTLQSILPVLDPDIWWHLRTGEWIVEHGTVPRVDEFSSYAIGKPWVAYSWLFEVVVYTLCQAFGLVGIVVYTTSFSLLIAYALHSLVRQFTLPFTTEIALTAVGLIAMKPLYSPRPWLFTVLFFIIELNLIFTARRTGDPRRLLLLPPLFMIWANTHIQFSYGLFVLGLAGIESLIDKLFHWPRHEDNSHPLPVGYLLGIVAACCVATLATPYHLLLYQTLVGLILQTGQFRDIVEMQSLGFRDPWDWFVLAATLGAVFALGWRKNIRPFPLLLLAAGAFFSFRARRDVWVVVTAAVAIIATACSTAGRMERFSLTKLRVACVVGMIFIVIAVVGWRRDISIAHLETVVMENYPTAATAFVKERGYSGPLYNDYNWGGFLIWRLRTIPVVMDNRGNVHGDERIERSIKTWTGQPGWESDPDLVAAHVVIAAIKMPLASLLRLDRRFELVYEDKVAAVFIAPGQSEQQKAVYLTLP